MVLQSGSSQSFGQMHFGNAVLGDRRRTKRLVYSADRVCRHPGGTLPDKFKSPCELRALYRLCSCPDVTHEAVLAPHRQRVLEQTNQRDSPVLVIHDSTELDYTTHLALKNRGFPCSDSPSLTRRVTTVAARFVPSGLHVTLDPLD